MHSANKWYRDHHKGVLSVAIFLWINKIEWLLSCSPHSLNSALSNSQINEIEIGGALEKFSLMIVCYIANL